MAWLLGSSQSNFVRRSKGPANHKRSHSCLVKIRGLINAIERSCTTICEIDVIEPHGIEYNPPRLGFDLPDCRYPVAKHLPIRLLIRTSGDKFDHDSDVLTPSCAGKCDGKHVQYPFLPRLELPP